MSALPAHEKLEFSGPRPGERAIQDVCPLVLFAAVFLPRDFKRECPEWIGEFRKDAVNMLCRLVTVRNPDYKRRIKKTLQIAGKEDSRMIAQEIPGL